MERAARPGNEPLTIQLRSFPQRRRIGLDHSAQHRSLQVDFFDAGEVRLSYQKGANSFPQLDQRQLRQSVTKNNANRLTDLNQINARELPRGKPRLQLDHRCLIEIG
jgi:hypothetical protein